MIQRTLLRQARAVASRNQSVPRNLLTGSQFRTGNVAFAQAARPLAARFYATEPESKTDAAENGAQEADPLKKELEAKNKEIIDLKVSSRICGVYCQANTSQDRYLRSVAEFRNLQERTKRDMQAAKDFAIQKFSKDLFDSVDNLDRALAMVPMEKINAKEKNGDLQELFALYEGLRMTESILMNTLKKNGLERFDPSVEGEPFDPNMHEATFMTPMEGKENNTVFVTQQKGFKLNGRVLRAAKVGVVKNA